MKNTAAIIGLRVGVAATAIAVAVSLSGCIQSTTALPGNGPTATSTPSASAKPTDTPTPVATAPTFSEKCDILLTAAQVYAFNPNYVADTGYKPKAGSIPAAIAAQSGQTCGWLNETSGSLIEVAVATPLPADLATAKATASTGTPISANGTQGYFTVANGIGNAQFFFGTLWLDVSSADFTTAADAQALYPIVVQNQRGAGG